MSSLGLKVVITAFLEWELAFHTGPPAGRVGEGPMREERGTVPLPQICPSLISMASDRESTMLARQWEAREDIG